MYSLQDFYPSACDRLLAQPGLPDELREAVLQVQELRRTGAATDGVRRALQEFVRRSIDVQAAQWARAALLLATGDGRTSDPEEFQALFDQWARPLADNWELEQAAAFQCRVVEYDGAWPSQARRVSYLVPGDAGRFDGLLCSALNLAIQVGRTPQQRDWLEEQWDERGIDSPAGPFFDHVASASRQWRVWWFEQPAPGERAIVVRVSSPDPDIVPLRRLLEDLGARVVDPG